MYLKKAARKREGCCVGMGVVFGQSRPTVTKRGSEMGQIEIDKYACTRIVPVCLLQENTTALTQGEQAVHTRAYKPPSGITYRGTHTT